MRSPPCPVRGDAGGCRPCGRRRWPPARPAACRCRASSASSPTGSMCAPARPRTTRCTWVYTRAGLPVEITAEFENWRRIRDWEGAEGWVYHSLLSGRRTAVVMPKSKDELVPLYEKPDVESAVIARLQSGVLGTVKRCNGSWCRVRRHGLRRLDRAGPAVGRLSEREGGVAIPRMPARRNPAIARSRTDAARGTSAALALAPQPHHHVDAGDLVACRRDRHLADDHLGAGNVDQLVLAFDEEVMMRRRRWCRNRSSSRRPRPGAAGRPR